MPRRIPRWTAYLLLVFATFTLILLFLEFAARRYLDSHPVLDSRAYLLTHPAAYSTAAYYNADFVDAAAGKGMTWDISPDCNCLLPGDITGRYFNVKDGFRQTVGQPQPYSCSIYVIGNSAVWGSYLPDDQTLPSQLQRLAYPCRVVNVGMLSANTTVDLGRLKTLDLHANDVVVFYTGVIEVTGIYQQAKNQEMDRSLCYHLPARLSKLALAELLCRWTDYQVPQIVQNKGQIQQAVSDMAATYRKNLEAARDYTIQRGAVFYNVLQPQIWSRSLSAAEASMADSPYEPYRGQAPLYEVAWPRLQQSFFGTIDLTHTLDSLRTQGETIYFDCCHVNGQANAILAAALWQHIRDF